jgi:hypothetical protein
VTVQVLVEVSGCPTTCMHCWALGGDYGAMPLEDAAFVLDELARFCSERELRYSAYPMHEVTAHPAAAEMIRLFAPHLGAPYDPILTPGTPLASRDDWEKIVSAAKECGASSLWAAYTPTSRGRRYETLRPELDDLVPVAERVSETSNLNREQWSDLPSHVEAAWVRRALDGDWPASTPAQQPFHQLVCRPNLDLYMGTSGVYRRRHGNLRRDGAQRVLERALANGPIAAEGIYFPNGGVSRTSELAASRGDPEGTRVYFEPDSMRLRWLDRAGAGSY